MNKQYTFLLVLLLFASCTPDQEAFLYETPASISPSSSYWHPEPDLTLQIQFAGTFDASVDSDVYDLDLFDMETATIADLHARGKKVICYISVGSWENWRPDASDFPPEVIGKSYAGWPGENWLDIRQLAILQPIMSSRLDLCAFKGFDGVEPDNIGVLGNDSGFPITYADQLAYALWIADAAHARGLAIGLKNAPEMVVDVVQNFDFALVEDCYEYDWCSDLSPFIEEGKPVFAVEYTDSGVDFQDACTQEQSLGLTMILKNRNLDSYRLACP